MKLRERNVWARVVNGMQQMGVSMDEILYASQPREKAAMDKKRYVKHKSGQGDKYEVHEVQDKRQGSSDWHVYSLDCRDHHYLPKSEYVLVEPVKRWIDVTRECEVCDVNLGSSYVILHKGKEVNRRNGYRIVRGAKLPAYLGDTMPYYFRVEQEQEVQE
jgi:hypothetical protein